MAGELATLEADERGEYVVLVDAGEAGRGRSRRRHAALARGPAAGPSAGARGRRCREGERPAARRAVPARASAEARALGPANARTERPAGPAGARAAAPATSAVARSGSAPTSTRNRFSSRSTRASRWLAGSSPSEKPSTVATRTARSSALACCGKRADLHGPARRDRSTGATAGVGSEAGAPAAPAGRAPAATIDGLAVPRGRGRAAPLARRDLRERQPLDLDLARSRGGDAELRRRAVGEVDDPAVLERAAVVDAHDHAAAVAQVRDAHVARDRQRRMRRGHREHVVDLAARGAVAVELAPVPRGGALLPEGHVGGQRRVAAAERGVGTVGAGMQRLDARHGVRRHRRDRPACGRAARRPGSSRRASASSRSRQQRRAQRPGAGSGRSAARIGA